MTHLLNCRALLNSICLIACLGLLACGGDYKSQLTDAERAVFDKFVAADVAALDDAGFTALIETRKELTAGTAAMNMSGEETEQATAQIEAMITRLDAEVAAESNAKARKTMSRELYQLRKAIGRGGA